MSTIPSPPSPTASQPTSRETTIRNISLCAIVLCPILIAIPPRKLDIYTVGLVSGTFFASNHLAQEYTGRSMVTRAQDRMASIASPSLPPKALETQRRLKEEKLQAQADATLAAAGSGSGEVERAGVLEELRKQQEREERRNQRGLVKRLWLGGEDEDWKAKRDQREKEALESGEGYGGLIMGQIKEVFGGVKEKVEEVKEIDEKVIEERKKN